MIPPDFVVAVLETLQSRSILFIVDGGWGIDALVEHVTRDHQDLDLAVDRSQVPGVLDTLREYDFARDDNASPGPPARHVLKDPEGREIDLHPLVFDDAGNGWQELGCNAWGAYPTDGIGAEGSIAGLAVRCVTADLQLRHHLGYAWHEADVHDMRLLQQHLGLRLPPPFDAQPIILVNAQIRPANASDLGFLEDMLYEAATWRDPHDDRDTVMGNPHVASYLSDWGRPGDTALVATDELGSRVGAAWFRFFSAEEPGYGFLDETIPGIAIAVEQSFRGRGVGIALMAALISAARDQTIHALSLSVETDNAPAVRLYEHYGFRRVSEREGALTMRLDL